MANWKKMAEAFGRAIQNPGLSEGGRHMVFNSKTVKTRPDVTDPRAPATEEQIAFDRGALDAAHDLANILEKSDVPDNSDVIQRQFDKAMTDRTNRALKRTREQEWDDAFKSAKEHVKRGYGDSYPEDMAEEGADAFEKQLWDVIDDLKAQGRSVEDILGALKSMGAK